MSTRHSVTLCAMLSVGIVSFTSMVRANVPFQVRDANATKLATPTYLTDFNGALFFSANDGSHGFELWKSDGTQSGTTLVKDINPGSGSSFPENLIVVNGKLFFRAREVSGDLELWVSDGTGPGTQRVKNISLAFSSTPQCLTDVNGTLFFRARDDSHGIEPWMSDGTDAGTTLVSDVNPFGNNSSPQWFAIVGSVLYFSADKAGSGRELWKFTTPGGAQIVRDIFIGSLNPRWLAPFGSSLFFAASDGTTGEELWKSNGLSAGTVPVHDLFLGPGGSMPMELLEIGGTLFFTARNGGTNTELWKTDGTTATELTVRAGGGGSDPSFLTNVNGTLHFAASDGMTGREIWKSDGFVTQRVTDVCPGFCDAIGPADTVLTDQCDLTKPSRTLIAVGPDVYFAATDNVHGLELWRTDGTLTEMAGDIRPGMGSSRPQFLRFSGGKLYFQADDGTGAELWALSLITDCNQNGMEDADDVMTGSSPDCNGNGIPDECDIPVDSPAPGGPFFCVMDCDPDCDDDGVPDDCFAGGLLELAVWTGAGGDNLWSTAENWCPAVVPNNTPQTLYAVFIGAGATVLLDIPVTISSLDLAAGASITALSFRSFTVLDGRSMGSIRAAGGSTLNLSGTIVQSGAGMLEADGAGSTLNLVENAMIDGGALQAAANGLIDMNGGTVSNALFRALTGGRILARNNGLLENPMVEQLDIPAANTAFLRGPLLNLGRLLIDAAGSNSSLLPAAGEQEMRLSSPNGMGVLEMRESLAGEFFGTARLGSSSASLVNEAGHTITGTGLIRGFEILNAGAIRATFVMNRVLTLDAGEEFGGLVTSTGTIDVEDMAALEVFDDLTLTGAPADLSLMTMHGQSAADVFGTLTLGAASLLSGTPARGLDSAGEVTAADVIILDGIGAGGVLLLTGMMRLECNGDFTMDGTLAGECNTRGCVPPRKVVTGGAMVDVKGRLRLMNSVDLIVNPPPPISYRLGGDFENHTIFPRCFDWLDGKLLMAAPTRGQVNQRFEVAGRDVCAVMDGFNVDGTQNFSMGSIEIAAGNFVDFIDEFDNDLSGPGGSPEALYVRDLILGEDSFVRVIGCKVYFVNITPPGGEALVQLLDGGMIKQIGGPGGNGCCLPNGTCANIDPGCCKQQGGTTMEGPCDSAMCCPAGQVNWIMPPDGVVDARQPHPLDNLVPRLGITQITAAAPAGASADCWSFCDTDGDSFNGIASVAEGPAGTYTLTLREPIATNAVTTIAYLGTGETVRFSAHPGNVNGDGGAGALDILAIIDCMNGVNPAVNCPWGFPFSQDIDHSGGFGASDILREIDVLNGADMLDPANGTALPGGGGCP